LPDHQRRGRQKNKKKIASGTKRRGSRVVQLKEFYGGRRCGKRYSLEILPGEFLRSAGKNYETGKAAYRQESSPLRKGDEGMAKKGGRQLPGGAARGSDQREGGIVEKKARGLNDVLVGKKGTWSRACLRGAEELYQRAVDCRPPPKKKGFPPPPQTTQTSKRQRKEKSTMGKSDESAIRVNLAWSRTLKTLRGENRRQVLRGRGGGILYKKGTTDNRLQTIISTDHKGQSRGWGG